jgi:8-oxo-dGTP pyrophosphatase MutT (NUDIX family)
VKLDPDHIRSRLQQPSDCPASTAPPHLQSAVLILLCPGLAEPVTILTRRSEDLPQHAGQVSFPGGRMHRDDGSAEATALREAVEETALDPSQVVLLGRLPVTVVPTSGFEITPVVAWSAVRPQLQADPREVAELIECPLKLALDPGAYRIGALERDGQRREFWYIEFGGHYVWGATARILRSLALALQDAAR